MDKLQKKLEFKHLILLVNPASTNYQYAKKMVKEVERQFSGKSVVKINTSPKGKVETAAAILNHAKKLGPKTLFCIVAGDGTVNFAINFLLTNKSLTEAARSTVLLPLWGGNGNDMATVLNGGRDKAKIERVLNHGKTVTIHPLYCRIDTQNHKQTVMLAGNSMGFGASGFLSKMLNSAAHRESKLFVSLGGKLPQTILTAWNGLNASKKFKIEESGRQFAIFERSIFNGPISAKFYHQPVRLQDDRFYMDTWRRKIPISTPLIALLSVRRRTLRRTEDHFFNKVEFKVLESVWAQFDAEPYRIPAGSIVEIGIFDRLFYVLSTKLKS